MIELPVFPLSRMSSSTEAITEVVNPRKFWRVPKGQSPNWKVPRTSSPFLRVPADQAPNWKVESE